MKNKKKRPLRNVFVLTFDKENRSVVSESVLEVVEHTVETETRMFNIEDCETYIDETTGYIYYVSNMDINAKVEASNLKRLRRSSAINNLFTYDTTKPLDIMKFVPYIIIVLLIMFK